MAEHPLGIMFENQVRETTRLRKVLARVWRCPECGLLSEEGGVVPHRSGCSLDGKSGVKLEPYCASTSNQTRQEG